MLNLIILIQFSNQESLNDNRMIILYKVSTKIRLFRSEFKTT